MHGSLCSYILNISSVIVQKKKKKESQYFRATLEFEVEFPGL